MKKLFLIDGMFFAYRSYYAISSLTDSFGRPTNAVFGFLKMLKKIMDNNQPDYLAVVFDLKAPTFRHIEFKGYKAQRKPTPDDLLVQLPLIREALEILNIPVIEKQGYEADDVIAAIAHQVAAQDIHIFIASNDKDLIQLINNKIKMYSFKGDNEILGEKEIKEQYNVPPINIVDILALSGDSADNIPGVEGVGLKTASKLISQYQTIENLYTNMDTFKKGKLREKLLAHKEEVFFNKNLIFLRKNVPLEFNFKELKVIEPDKRKLMEFFKKLEFRTLLKDFLGEEKEAVEKVDFREISNDEDVESLVEKIYRPKEVILDIDSAIKKGNQVKGIALKVSSELFYVNLSSGQPSLFKKVKLFLEDAAIKKIGYDLKEAKIALATLGIDLQGIHFDTKVAVYLINPSKPNYSLAELILDYLNKTVNLENSEGSTDACCRRVFYLAKLKLILKDILQRKKLAKLFEEVEMPLVAILSDMELKGVELDSGLLKEMSQETGKHLKNLEEKIYAAAQEEFNINSPKALSHILFKKLKLPVQKKTKTGYSTDTEVLEKLSLKHLLPAKILEYRKNMKLKSTYIDALPKLINGKTGRIHTSFNQTVTSTGRLSSSNPNLQNVPVRTDIGKEIRKAFIVSKPNTVLLGADYSQIELRILTHLSQDKNLLSAFKDDEDIHTFTASLIFGVSKKQVTQEMRGKAKTINFGIIYGMSTYGLSRDLKISFAEAKNFIDTYFARYQGVAAYIDQVIKEAKVKKYVKTILNRRRYLPEINSENLSTRQFAERTAVNTVVQGSAADLIKMAMIKIAQVIKEKKYESRALLQIHDELVFEVLKRELVLFQEEVQRLMENALCLDVPLKVNLKIGRNWGEL